jgi:hypothetical protein
MRGAGSLRSSSADQSGAILISTANRAGSRHDATGSWLPASPAPSRARLAARSDIGIRVGAALRGRAEIDLSVAAAGRPLDAEARQPQVPGRRAMNTEGEHGNQGGKNRDHAHDGMAATQKSLGFSPRFGVLSREHLICQTCSTRVRAGSSLAPTDARHSRDRSLI